MLQDVDTSLSFWECTISAMDVPVYDIIIYFSLNAKVYKNKIMKINSEIHAKYIFFCCFLFNTGFNNNIKRDEFN